MALIQPIASTATNAEPSQEIATTNALINQINAQAGTILTSSFVANGAVATALTSVGPTGSHATVQKWLQVTDNTGTVGFIPIF